MEKEQEEQFVLELMKYHDKDNKEKFIEMLLFYFDEEIENMSRYIKMPREDAIQSIKTDFIEYITNHW
ncbi:hypothetical protein LOZ80_29950 [Paenibacillus sp. HWE-109]|uniref:hypothetical protein n=1 Tax=Paenibacillus sp. HWE-109 TaxID=1306526 RepID=UPI001EDF8A3F|nr:hypothetical protein [Paenibacillus sp. HWE-109]UKS25745.1 hypothetical protein LOZ80_29950 [Paenibacillus sp. HWE-109]